MIGGRMKNNYSTVLNNLDELKEQLQEDLMAYLMGSPLEQYALDDICWFIVDRIDSIKERGLELS